MGVRWTISGIAPLRSCVPVFRLTPIGLEALRFRVNRSFVPDLTQHMPNSCPHSNSAHSGSRRTAFGSSTWTITEQPKLKQKSSLDGSGLGPAKAFEGIG